MSLVSLQIRYILGALAISPFVPFLYLQSRYVRRSIGRLPDAAGNRTGKHGARDEFIKLLAIGESTVAGVGASNHAEALTGQFARHLSEAIGKTVHWHALGESGITVGQTLRKLVPQLPDEEFDVVLIALGGNDVFGLSSPNKWRREMTRLLKILREKYPSAEILIANVPMVRDFRAMPNPLRYVLSRLAKLQHFNSREFVAPLEKIIYFDAVKPVDDDFFSDGIHPSATGYDLWARDMVEFMQNRKN
ncbi:MAG: SGNH/GDSL hydrolase family protein [Acidobacteriota bacterium]|nr:SGNH/GDSL hydrolase family protein [Acidobacteriota bacterium]